MVSNRAGSLAIPDPILSFDRLSVGDEIGSVWLQVDEPMLDAWQRVYGRRPGAGPLPLAFAPLLLMRAFLTIVTPRPPGNLHVGQTYRVRDMPPPHSAVLAAVRCSSKELRRERRIVSFAIGLAGGRGEPPCVSGKSTMFWAA